MEHPTRFTKRLGKSSRTSSARALDVFTEFLVGVTVEKAFVLSQVLERCGVLRIDLRSGSGKCR